MCVSLANASITPAPALPMVWFGTPAPLLNRAAVYGPERVPVVTPVTPLVRRFTPGLEREARAVAAFAVHRGIAGRVVRIGVDVVVVPASPSPLVPVVARCVGVALRSVARHRGH